MDIVFLGLIILGIKAYFIYRFWSKLFKATKKDYSFGIKETIEIIKLIDKKQFQNAENRLASLKQDVLNHTIDSLAFASSESQILKWINKSDKKSEAYLVLSVYYYNKAWKKRGTKLAAQLNKKQIDSYTTYLKLSLENLNQVNGLFYEEAQSRLIAVFNGLGERELAENSFLLATKKSKNNLQAYLHYSEVVLPKWGGGIEEMQKFKSQWPNIHWIKRTLQLKEAYDSLSEFYSELDNEYYKNTKDLLNNISIELEKQPWESPHVFILYAYMYLLSSAVDDKIYTKKYKKLLNNNLTIYPFGIL